MIHRSDLHRVLLEACEAAGVRLVNDVMVESVETVNGRGVAHTAAGVDYEADVVIGADGLKSTLRPLVAQDGPVSSSYVAYRGHRADHGEHTPRPTSRTSSSTSARTATWCSTRCARASC